MTGILLLDKPLGLSSNRALQTVKRLLGAEKAGHVGSLDPLATGMLPICLDEATKIAGEILAGRKCYRFTVQLGSRTATGDREGEVVETCDIPELNPAAIDEALHRFTGPQTQVPPMYSAIKKQGQPLYRLARAGIEVERAPRDIEIFGLRRLRSDAGTLELEAQCSKGTYVRTLAEDLARTLGTCGHVIALRRMYVEPFEDEPMETLESIESALAQGRLPRMHAPDRGVQDLPAVRLEPEAATRLRQGQAVPLASEPTQLGNQPIAGKVRLYAGNGPLLGLGEVTDGIVRPRRLFVLVSEGVP